MKPNSHLLSATCVLVATLWLTKRRGEGILGYNQYSWFLGSSKSSLRLHFRSVWQPKGTGVWIDIRTNDWAQCFLVRINGKCISQKTQYCNHEDCSKFIESSVKASRSNTPSRHPSISATGYLWQSDFLSLLSRIGKAGNYSCCQVQNAKCNATFSGLYGTVRFKMLRFSLLTPCLSHHNEMAGFGWVSLWEIELSTLKLKFTNVVGWHRQLKGSKAWRNTEESCICTTLQWWRWRAKIDVKSRNETLWEKCVGNITSSVGIPVP